MCISRTVAIPFHFLNQSHTTQLSTLFVRMHRSILKALLFVLASAQVPFAEKKSVSSYNFKQVLLGEGVKAQPRSELNAFEYSRGLKGKISDALAGVGLKVSHQDKTAMQNELESLNARHQAQDLELTRLRQGLAQW